VAANGPLESARVIIAVASIALILFQGPKGDGVVNQLNESRVFGSASEAKSAVDYITGGLIGGFIVISAILAAGATGVVVQPDPEVVAAAAAAANSFPATL